jgi:murein DD-endopeptidase MepM/ murein hydrolase activator NlpD
MMNRFVLLALGVAAFGGGALAGAPPRPVVPAAVPLPPVRAVGVRLDTLYLGGYASGTFAQAVRLLASELSPAERALVGRHLDRVFEGVVEERGLGRSGRLRVAYERAVGPDGATRSIRVLTAEAAVGGRMHTAFFFEHADRPGYYDEFGRALDAEAWAGPLPELQVTSAFGLQRMHPMLGRVLPHTGTDYRAPMGAPVQATGDGIVAAAGPNGGYGNMVEIRHPSGYSTRYAHLSRLADDLAPGHAVRQGEVVGFVGMSGLANAPHLHYEVRRHGRPVDPERVRAGALSLSGVDEDPRWPAEQQRLTGLLARAPTLQRARRTGGG